MTNRFVWNMFERGDFPDAVWDLVLARYGQRYMKALAANPFLGSRVTQLCTTAARREDVLYEALIAGNREALEIVLEDASINEGIANIALIWWTLCEADQVRLVSRPLPNFWTSALQVGLTAAALAELVRYTPESIGVTGIPQEAPVKTQHCSHKDLEQQRARGRTAWTYARNTTLTALADDRTGLRGVTAGIISVLANEMGDGASESSRETWANFFALLETGPSEDLVEVVEVARGLRAEFLQTA